jgi:hypothetical protein
MDMASGLKEGVAELELGVREGEREDAVLILERPATPDGMSSRTKSQY